MAGNVNADAFLPKIWDAKVYRTLENNLVVKKICTAKSTKQAKGYGDTLYFNGLGDPTIGDYSGSLTYEDLVSSQIALLIDQQKKYSFKITDVEGIMANVDLEGSQASRAGYALANEVEKEVFGNSDSTAIAGAGHTAPADTTCDSTSILSGISGMIRILQENNVRRNNIWVLVPPWVQERLMLAGIVFQIKDGGAINGGVDFVKYNGATIYVSNNVYNSNTAADPVSTILAGSYDAIVYSEVLNKSRAMELEGSFEVGLSGLLVFGSKVVKPKELVKKIVTAVAETNV